LKNQDTDQKTLLGVDVGNSKTHALITDLSGNVLGFGETGCGSYEVLGLDGMTQVLLQVTQEAIKDAGIDKTHIAGMGFGIAGYDWPAEKGVMIETIESLGIHAPYNYVNDAVIGLLAGSEAGWGIAVDAGTGNNVRGRDQNGRIGRITGNGALFGEIGGAAEMVWQAQIAVTYAWTKRGPKTRLTNLFLDYGDVHNEEALIEGLAMEEITLSPAIAREIFHLAADGDAVASSIVTYCAKELGLNVNAVIKQLNLQEKSFDIVLIGSIFRAGEIYISPFREIIQEFAPEAKLITLSVPPVVGSVMLAAEVIHHQSDTLRTRLIKSTEDKLSMTGNQA